MTYYTIFRTMISILKETETYNICNHVKPYQSEYEEIMKEYKLIFQIMAVFLFRYDWKNNTHIFYKCIADLKHYLK